MLRFPRLVRPALVYAALVCGAVHAAGSDNLPPALRNVNPRWLSGGLYSALDAQGAFGVPPVPVRARDAGVADLSKGKPPAVLDARVGVNLRLGDDSAALPSSQRGQAEPHITRSAASPEVLLATFQDGRFAASGGAIDCGYALSRDGGLTWTRALIPQLTTASGGPYLRATDPVAAIGPQGELYLSTLASLDNAFGTSALVVSRSIDNGVTWSAPVVAFQQTTPLALPDKDWLAVNDFPGTPNPGRVVVTWTNFTSNAAGAATGDNLLSAVSDDRGTTWSAPIAITPAGSLNQGSLPLFLPDGSLVVVYSTFANANTNTLFSIQCKRSTDGGRTYPAAALTAVGLVNGWADPVLRSGVFLPAAAVARQTGDIFVCYTAIVAGSPRVVVIKSTDKGTSWSAPIVASDNSSGVSVDNPAIAVTPDGQTVSVVFMDKRNAPDGQNFIDHYAAQSFDGGATWQPNLRLTEMSSDVRYAALTSQGYMLGDYLAVAPSLTTDQPCIAIWCDTRTGDADPFIVRFAPEATPSYTAWSHARISPGIAFLGSFDSDNDGEPNYLEYLSGTDPRQVDYGETLVVARSSPTTVDVAWAQRANLGSGEGERIYPIRDPTLDFLTTRFTSTVTSQLPATDLTADQLPRQALRAGLAWRGSRIAVPPGVSIGAKRYFHVTGEFFYSALEGATINTDSRLINLSARGQVKTGASQLIVGFVIDGQKSVLVRAAGPGLASFGVPGALADPQLTLTSDDATFANVANDNWQQGGTATATLFSRLGAFPFATGSLDAALVQTLGARSYTALVSGANGGTGIGLVEAYDADPTPGAPSGPRLVNLSTRGEVGIGANALVAGFVIGGTQPRRMLIRAVGPSLAQFSLGNLLADPVLTLYQGPTPLATNDDWEISRSSAAIAATAQNVGAFALNPASLDAALLITLAPGAYSAVVNGVNGTTGLALVEVYDAD